MKQFRLSLLNFLLHPALLSLPVAALLILLLPDRFSRYEVKLVDRMLLGQGVRIITHDLDHDGYFERIAFGEDINTTFVTINNTFRTFDQWNLERKPETNINRCIIGDANLDGYDEVYVLTYRNDSLFLSAIDIQQKRDFVFFERFISKLGTPVHIDIYNLFPGAVIDLDGDQSGEVVFSINSGYSKFPRSMFTYDIRRDSLLKSPELGANLSGNFFIQDLNNDQSPDFLLGNYASMNYDDTTGIMHDHAAYLIALDHRLQFLFPPVKYPGDYVNVKPYPYKRNDSSLIMSYVQGNDVNDPLNNRVFIYDHLGQLKQTSLLPNSPSKMGYTILNAEADKDKHVMAINPLNQIYILNEGLHMKESFEISVRPIHEQMQFDIDKDGHNEFFVLSADYENCLILRHNLKHTAKFEVPVKSTTLYFYPWQEKPDSPPGFMMQYDDTASFYTYTLNPLSYLLYVFHLLIYLSVFAFVLLIRKLQRKQLQRKYETEQQIAELKLLTIYNQINPHFTFNVLNTIGSVILQHKPEKGYDLLMKFARMIRNLLNSSDSIYRSLNDEAEFVTDFLELQQSRTDEAFSFEIHIDPTVDITRPVPKMVLQTHAENAVKHGIIPLKKPGGQLEINLENTEDHLKITITDNGIGRMRAAGNSTYSTGKGIAILNQTFHLLNQRKIHPIRQSITDLYDDSGNPTGTSVVILIPNHFDFGQTK